MSTTLGEALKNWFVFHPEEDFGPSAIDASGWLDAPAGRHGFVQPAGEGLAFEDGTVVQFWGVNICNGRVACDAATAERWAGLLAKYGVNGVRFHKFTWPGEEGIGSGVRSPDLDPAKLARMDAFVARMHRAGIYLGWSHIYGHRVMPGDRERLAAYDEVAAAGANHLKGSTIGLVHFAPDLQDLSIELTVNLLEHVNADLGQRYADDAGLAFIELQNEDDIFFSTTMNWVEQCPTYKRLFCEQFSDWLRGRYGDHKGLVEAWGARALDAYPDRMRGEHLDARNLYPIAHDWWFSPEGLAKQQAELGTGRRLLDTARFLYETQNAFYDRFAAAIRATGYRGCIVGSCWQAGTGVSHYYNLHSDARMGLVDRHNYFGGGTGHNMEKGPVRNRAMVQQPGSGLLSTGRQMVKGQPFQISEWISMLPNEWIAEGAPVVAVYGLGLQGWAASYVFASNYDRLTETLDMPNVYNANNPTQMGLYPALARMLYRGDVRPAEPLAVRHVHIPSLLEGRVGFEETVKQKGDQKAISGDLPAEALAIGKVQVEYTDTFVPTETPDLSKWIDTARGVVRSMTGQLAWHGGEQGYFTVDTPGTAAVVGFAGGQQCRLAQATLEVYTPFVVLFVTSLDREKGIGQAERILVTAIARARNSGMRYNADHTQLEDVGGPPILLEPVRARIALTRPGTPTVHVLDHVGRRTGRTVPVSAEGFTIDGAEHQAIYYEVTYEK